MPELPIKLDDKKDNLSILSFVMNVIVIIGCVFLILQSFLPKYIQIVIAISGFAAVIKRFLPDSNENMISKVLGTLTALLGIIMIYLSFIKVGI